MLRFFALLMFCTSAVAGDGSDRSADLRVVISTQSTSSPQTLSSATKAGTVQFIDTVVTNVGTRPRALVAWTQYGWSWMSDTKDVSPGIEAVKNAPERFVLEPGGSYARAVEVFTDGKRPVTFRLGFFPMAEVPVSGRVPPLPITSISWSNAITLR